MLRARAQLAWTALLLAVVAVGSGAAPGATHSPPLASSLARLGPPTVPSGDATLGPANFRPGARTVLVLVAQIAGQTAPGSNAAMRNIIFTAPNSANAFVQAESFGQISLTGKLRSDGDVYGPYSVTSTNPPDVCDEVAWGQQAEQAFTKDTGGLDPETWDEVMVVFEQPACNFSGIGEIGQLAPGARHIWLNPVLSDGVPTTSVIAHELGHNFGVDHAGGLECYSGSTRIAFSDACGFDPKQSVNEYLDPLDVMGNGIHQESAYHKWESGWLPSSSVQTVSRSGTYLIAPEEAPSSGLQLLEVPRAPGIPSFWLDFRQPFGSWFDTFSPSDPAVNGVGIRYANSSSMPHAAKSWLIDTTPDTTTFEDAPLAAGKTFTDPSHGISVTTNSVSPLGAVVTISMPGTADTSPPSAPGGLSAVASGAKIVLSWTPASDDSGVVQRYQVRRNGSLLADLYATSATDSEPSVGQTASYDIQAVDPAGNVGPAARINVTLADTTPPSQTTGLEARVSGSSVSLDWSAASDDVGVASYEVDRNGVPIAVGLHATSLVQPDVPVGTYTYTVRAFDGAGNAGPPSASATVELAGTAKTSSIVALRLRTISTFKLRRLGTHRVVVSWKAQKGVKRYEVLRVNAKKKGVLLATVRKVEYTDGRALSGALIKSRYQVRAVLN